VNTENLKCAWVRRKSTKKDVEGPSRMHKGFVGKGNLVHICLQEKSPGVRENERGRVGDQARELMALVPEGKFRGGDFRGHGEVQGKSSKMGNKLYQGKRVGSREHWGCYGRSGRDGILPLRREKVSTISKNFSRRKEKENIEKEGKCVRGGGRGGGSLLPGREQGEAG